MFILGSCVALNLSYFGCCDYYISASCSNNGCFCDMICHKYNDCCSDIADIGCHPASILGNTKWEVYAIFINRIFSQKFSF